METLAYASRSQRIRHFVANITAFALCYQATNFLAEKKQVTASVAIALDHSIPFLEWMILPYMCSSIFFIWSFFKVASPDNLRVLSQRMLLATVVAAMLFLFFPLQFSKTRPVVESPLFASLFGLLSKLDRPYNQLPSLHLAYCVIFWQSLSASFKTRWTKALLAGSLLLISVSTVFTYQHHLLDMPAGLALGAICIAVIRPHRAQIHVAFYYLIMAMIVFLLAVMLLQNWWAIYLVISLLLVAYAYQANHRHFLHKQSGQHSLWIWILYAPYLIGYRLTWYWVQHREKHHPAFRQYADQLWTGRRLNNQQMKRLPANCLVVDLSPELSELPALRTNDYRHFPLLDLINPETAVVNEISQYIHEQISAGRNVYLHCAMGYQRSIWIAQHLSKKTR
jgi:PAP2 superfamily